MNKFINSVKNVDSLHHAYFFIGQTEEIRNSLLKFFAEKLKIKTLGNPDFIRLEYITLSVDDARKIKELSEKKNLDDGIMVFIISFEDISVEAQNSLLKILEEPTPKTHFFLVSARDNLLPTLKSRVEIVRCENLKVESRNMSKSLFDMTYKDRLGRVKKIVESISDEESTKQSAIDFVNQIEQEIYEDGILANHLALENCQNARAYLLQRGAPVKMILENLVLSI